MRYRNLTTILGLAFFIGAFDGRAVAATFWLEAESVQDHILEATLTSPLLIRDDLAASGGSYVEVAAGHNSPTAMPAAEGVATYGFEVETSATFRVWARVIAPTPSDDSFWIQMDGGAPMRWNDIALGAQWHWTAIRTATAAGPAVFPLGTGSHTLRIAYREDGARLDALVITDDDTFDPSALSAAAPQTPRLRVSSEDSTASALLLSWNAVPGAQSYTIVRDGEIVKAGETGHRFVDRGLARNGCYEVFAVGSAGTSAPPPFCQSAAADRFIQRRGVGDLSLTPFMVDDDGALTTSPGTASSLNAPPAHGRARYDFRIAAEASLKVWAIVDALDPARDSFWVRMDDGAWIKWNNIPGPFECDDVHDSDRSGRAVRFDVTAGSHRLELAYREAGTTLGHLAIADPAEVRPCAD